MDITVKKHIGYLIGGIWGAWGFAILAVLLDITENVLWIATIETTWYAIDAFIIFFIHYYFNVEIKTPEKRLQEVLIELKEIVPLVDPEIYKKYRNEIIGT